MNEKVIATLQIELPTYIDVFDLLDLLSDHVSGSISWTVRGTRDRQDQPVTETKAPKRQRVATRAEEIIAETQAVAEAAAEETADLLTPTDEAKLDEIIEQARQEAKYPFVSRNLEQRYHEEHKAEVKERKGAIHSTASVPTAEPFDEETKARHARERNERLRQNMMQAQRMSTADRLADAEAVEAQMERPDLAHFSRQERRELLRRERKAKRNVIKRAMEAQRIQALLEWLGSGDPGNGEETVVGIACPYCNAEPNLPCHTASGYEYPSTFHLDRFRAAAEVLELDFDQFNEELDEKQERYHQALNLLRSRRS